MSKFTNTHIEVEFLLDDAAIDQPLVIVRQPDHAVVIIAEEDITVEGKRVSFTLTPEQTTKAGEYQAQLEYFVNSVLKRTERKIFDVEQSLNSSISELEIPSV